MPYQVLTTHEINQRSGLVVEATNYQMRLQEALQKQKDERGMELVAVDHGEPGSPLYIFRHETD